MLDTLLSVFPAYVAIIIVLAYYLLLAVAYWKMFKKASQPGWKGIIPFYNTYMMYKISWSSSWFWAYLSLVVAYGITTDATLDSMVFDVLAMIVGIVYIIVKILSNYKISKAYGHGVGYAILLILFPNVMTLVLGFGKSQYQGPQ